MKARSTGKKRDEGIITLEILLAFAIIILNIGAVILVAFGNQALTIDSETNQEAISSAQGLIEKARRDSRYDFNLVNSSSETVSSGSLIFTKQLEVTQIDWFTKKVMSTVSWQVAEKTLWTAFTTLLTNPEGENGDTCSSVLTGDWKNPQIESAINFSSITPSGTYSITDMDAYKGKLYVTAGRTSNVGDPTFFIFNISDTSDPELISQIDNDSESLIGMNSLAVNGNYAYVANASRPATTGQLQIIDINNETLPAIVKNFPLTGNSAQGNSIFLKDGYAYLGTKSSGSYEFNIINVSIPLAPVVQGVYFIGNDINSILVRSNYAYIASPNTQELQILDITDMDTIVHAGEFSMGSGNGKNIQIVGDKIYFGRTTDGGAGEDFQILDNTNPDTTLARLGGLNISSSVNSLVIRDYLSFLLTGTAGTASRLQILKTDDPENIIPWNVSPLFLSPTGNAIEPSMDCEGNRLYISPNNSGGQGTIYIIKPSNE